MAQGMERYPLAYVPDMQVPDVQVSLGTNRAPKIEYLGEIGQAPAMPAPANENSGIGGDSWTDIKRGVQQIPGAVTGLLDIPFALTINERPISEGWEAVGGMTKFQPGKWAKAAEAEYTPERKAQMDAVSKAWDATGGSELSRVLFDPSRWNELPTQWDRTDAAAVFQAIKDNPRATWGTVLQSLPSTVAGGGASLVARSLAKIPAAVAAGIGEGAITAGMAMDQIDRKVDPRKAAVAAMGAGAVTGLIGGASGAMASRLGIPDIEMPMPKTGKAYPLYARVPVGAVKEGLFEEGLQAPQEQVWQNLAEGKPAGEGALRAGVEGAIAGAALGGAYALRRPKPDVDLADTAIPFDGAGPGGNAISGEFIPADPRQALPNLPEPGATYDQNRPALPPGQTMLPLPMLPAPEDGGPSERQIATARGLLNHSPKASPELLQRLMRVDQATAAMLFNHWQGLKNGEVAGNQGAQVPAEGGQGQGADDAGSGILDGQRDGAMPFAMGEPAALAAPGGEPGMAVGATGAGADAVTPLDVQAHGAATSPYNATPQPTEAQKKAGNYAKGHVRFNGMDISIENPAGSVRSGTDEDGKAWENTLQHHYGYIKGTVGRDKDHLDVFIKPGAQSARTAYVIDQINPKTGRFDEHKIVLGASSEAEARAIYKANYADGWNGLGEITAMPIATFKGWIKSGKTKKPIAYVEPKEVRAAARKPATASNILQAIVNRGGISRDIMSDVGADTSARYMPGLFTNNGTTDLSTLAGDLFDEDGFHQIRQDSDIGPARELEDLITRALGGEKILSTAAMEKGMQAEENAKLKEKARRLGVKTVARKIEDIAADVARAEEQSILDEETRLEDDALVAYNEAVDALREAVGEDAAENFLEDLASRYQDETHLNYLRSATVDLQEQLNAEVQASGKPDEVAAGQAGSGYETGLAQGGADSLREAAQAAPALSSQSEALNHDDNSNHKLSRKSRAEGGRLQGDTTDSGGNRQNSGVDAANDQERATGRQAPSFTLDQQTEEDLAARDREQKAAEAQRLKDEQAAENKRQADAERGSFNLTGSDRPADVLAAQGQGDIFAQSNQEPRATTPVAESQAPATSEPGDAGVAPGRDGGAPDIRDSQTANERQKDAKGNPIYKMGDRVEYVDGGYKGRHGEISQVTPMVTTTLGIGRGAGYYAQSRETSYYYHVKTDNGADFMASPEEIQAETRKPARDEIVMDPEFDGRAMEPEALHRAIAYARQSADKSRAAAQRARKASMIDAHKRSAALSDEKAKRLQAVWDGWAAHYPDEAEKIAPKPAAKPAAPAAAAAGAPAGDVLKAAGLVVTKGTTNNGKTVWNVSGNTREHMGIIKAMGGRWYGPKKVWSFYNDDPTATLTLKLGGQVTIAGTPTIKMPDRALEQIAASSQPAAEKAKAELAARDQADDVDLGQLFDEVLAEETAPKAKPAQKSSAPEWWNALTGNERYWKMKAAGIDGTASTPWNRLTAEQQQAMSNQWGPLVGTETPAAIEMRNMGAEAFRTGSPRVVPDYFGASSAKEWYRGWDDANVGAGETVGKELAPGTRINGAIEKAAADRLELLLDQFYGDRGTPVGAARSAIRSVVEELRKERTVISVKDVLETASGRMMRNFPAQARVVDEVVESLGGKPQRTAGQAAASAAINTGKGLLDAIDGLGKLFGSNGSRLSMGISFDEDTYAKAKPLFAQAVAHFKDAGADLKEAMRAVVRLVLDKFGPQVTENMKPYIVQFMEDVKSGNVVYDETKEAGSDGNDRGRPETAGTGSAGQRDGGGDAAPRERPGRDPEAGDREGDRGDGTGRAGGGQSLDPMAQENAGAGSRGQADRGDQGRGGAVAPGAGTRGSEPLAGRDREPATVRDRPGSTTPGAVAGTPSKTPSTEGVSVSGKADFQITEDDNIGEGGQKTKARNNIAAIRLLKKLDSEDRRATPAEQKVLAKYVGWGGIKQIFDDSKADWAKERNEFKALVTDQEYAAARRSMLDAHYTSTDVVAGMWAAAAHLGFKGGRVLEPSVGVGNFFGLMPADVRAHSQLYGVELDRITAQLAQNLYPSATIANMGFQDVELPSGSFDIAIGNPPFGDQSLYDKNHPELRSFPIHSFFFAKTLDKIRPGGIMPLVVSRYLMDSRDAPGFAAREYLAGRAKLLGAIRLPYNAFLGNANTEVVTDIIFLQKLRDGETAERNWSSVKDIETTHPKTGEKFSFPINEYFIAHPEMVLGTHAPTGKMRQANQYNVEPFEGESIFQGLGRAIANLPRDVMTPAAKPLADIMTAVSEVPEGTKVLGYYMAGNVVMQRQSDAMGKRRGVPVEFKDATAPKRAEAMIGIRNAVRDLMRAERADLPDSTLATKRARLTKLYDAFKGKYGYINQPANRRAFRDDPDLPLLESLEPKFDPGLGAEAAKKRGEAARKPAAEKADIFTKRVLPAHQEITSVSSANDALVVSLNMKGDVDPEYMAELYGKPWDQIRAELGALVFHNPNGGWESADAYLSGNVKAKLKIAEDAAARDPQYAPNVEALQAVIPADVPALKISVRLGSPWIPPDVMAQFASELWGVKDASIKFVKQVSRWAVKADGGDPTARTSTWGVTYTKLSGGSGIFGADMILDHVANNRAIVIKENLGDSEHPNWQTNERATEAIRAKAQEMATKFREWIWQDQDRRDRLAKIYNETYNTDKRRAYDGSHLTLPGSSSLIKLRAHQLNAVWRAIQDRVILLDHVVGAGKTYEMAAIAMELRRLGITRKPMFVVPNSLVRQWRDEFYKLYPDANVLAATEADFAKANRKRFMAKIATGDWDAVIVAHSSFKKVGMPYETEKAILDEQLKEISDAIEDMKRERGDKNVVRDMERIKLKLEERMKSLADRGGKKDDTVSFDELGVDGLFVDEAHLFKNLFYYSQMRNVTGLGNPNGSGRAFDLFVKTRFLDQQYAGKALVGFATGTPVSNSLVEMFTMQRYLAWNKLKENGLHLLDAWAGVYGDVQQVYEVHPSGTGYRLTTRFAKFVNLPSLMELYRGFADVITMDDLKQQAKDAGGVFPVPKIKGGKPRNIVAERSEQQRRFFGVPEFGRDDKGGIAFKYPAELFVRKSDKDGKWYPWLKDGSKIGNEGFDTEAEAEAERATLIKLPVVGWNSGSILHQFENLKQLTKDSKGKINALSITNQARKAGLDYRLIDPAAADFAGSKINLAVKEAVRIYHAWAADKGAQLMFCDLSVPKTARAAAASKERNAYVRAPDGGLDQVKATVVTIEGVEASFLAVKRGGKGAEGGYVLYDGLTGAHTGIAEHQKKDAVDALKAKIERDGLGWLEDLQDRYGEITDADIADYKDATGKEEEAGEEGDEGAISVAELMALAGGNTFSVYDDIKAKLIDAGIPASEIAFIHDFDTAAKKNDLFKKVRAGDIRILLGSTEKMGAGMNVQERLVALHHLDAPWRPSDLEQREGRIIRQGNKLYERDPDGFEVELMRYGTRQTYDTRMWQIIEHKAAGVEQLRKAGDDLLEIDDIGGEAANAADMKAAASGNPLILDEIKLRNEVRSLEAQQFAHIQAKANLQDKARWYRGAPDRAEKEIAEIQPMVDMADKIPADPFRYTTPDGKVLEDKKDVALPLTTAFADAAQSKLGETIDAGQYRGLLIRFRKSMSGITAYLGSGAKPLPAATYGMEDKFSPSGLFTRLDNALERLKATIAGVRSSAASAIDQVPKLEAEIAKPFAREDALKDTRDRHRAVVSKLQKSGGGIELSPEMRAELDAAIAARSGKTGMESRGKTRAVDTNSPEFKAWFGDSKVVDEDGNPLRVYHGTVADIKAFDPAKGGGGLYFAELPDGQVNAYSDAEDGNIIQAYLSIKNPATVDQFLAYGAASNEKSAIDRLRFEGYDGVKYPKEGSDDKAVWIAFRPEQVKSAISNTGSFSRTNPSILESRTPTNAAEPATESARIVQSSLSLLSGIASAILPDKVLDGVDRDADGGGNLGIRRATGPHGERLVSIPADALRAANVNSTLAQGSIEVGGIGPDLIGNSVDAGSSLIQDDGSLNIVGNGSSGVSGSRRANAASSESGKNSRPVQSSKGIRDLLIGGPLLAHLKRLVEIPGQRFTLMKSNMVPSGENLKIVDGVIQAIPVDMVDVFVSGKTATGKTFRNLSMFVLPSDSLIESISLLDDVSGTAQTIDSFGFGHDLPSYKNTSKIRQLEGVVKRFLSIFPAANQLSIKVVWAQKDLPSHVRASTNAEAIYLDDYGQVFLVASNIFGGDSRTFQILLHECVGHFGLAQMMGSRFAGILKQVQQAARAKGKVTEDTYQPGDTDYATMEAVRLRYPEASDAEVAQEVLARIAETDPGRTLFGYVRAVVRQWLRDMARVAGFDLDVTTAELNDLVALASAYMRRGGNLNESAETATAGSAVASRKVGAGETAGGMESRRAPGAGQWRSPTEARTDDLLYKMQDKHIDLKRVQEGIKAAIGGIRDDIDAYLQEELFHGRAAKMTEEFLERELQPFTGEMKQRGITMEVLENFLWARHAKERNAQIAKINPDMPDGGSGLTDKQAADLMAGKDVTVGGQTIKGVDQAKLRSLNDLARKVDMMVAGNRILLETYELETPDTVAAWKGAYKHYVPLHREDADAPWAGPGTGMGYSVRGSSTKRATGSFRPVENILANLVLQRTRTITRGEKNRVSQALYGLAKEMPNPEFWNTDDAPKIRTVENKAIYHVMDGQTEIANFTNMADAERKARGNPAWYVYQDWGDRVVEKIDPTFRSKPNVVWARFGGEDRFVIFNERDPRAARMAESIKNLDADDIGNLLGEASRWTRYFASINTQYNPIFGVINLFRDAGTGLLNLKNTPLEGQQKALIGNLYHTLPAIYKAVRTDRAGGTPTGVWADLWEEFQEVGGKTGYRDMFRNSHEQREALEKALDPKWWQDKWWGKTLTLGGTLAVPEQFFAEKIGKPVFEWLSDYNTMMENGIRLSAYKVALDQGMSKERAASVAKNLTVNFNRKGQVARQAGALYAFFNASVQGTARMAETLHHGARPGELLGKAGKQIVYGGMLLGSMQALMLMAAGFDDDEPPEFVRDRNIVLPIPFGDKKYLTLPLPLGFHVLPAIGRISTEFVAGGFRNPGKHLVHILDILADSFNPIGNAGLSMQTIAPTVLDPAAALAENKDWTGKPIYREDLSKLSPTPGHARTKDTANALSKGLAYALNAVSGGTEFKQGLLSPTPDQIDYLIGQVTGGVGREVSKVMQTGSAMLSGEDLPPHKMPLVGRFYGDAKGQSAVSSRFYDNLKTMNEHQAEYMGLAKSGRSTQAGAYLKENPEAAMFREADRMQRYVSQLRKQKTDLVAKSAPREQVKVIEDRISKAMADFNQRVESIKNQPPKAQPRGMERVPAY